MEWDRTRRLPRGSCGRDLSRRIDENAPPERLGCNDIGEQAERQRQTEARSGDLTEGIEALIRRLNFV